MFPRSFGWAGTPILHKITLELAGGWNADDQAFGAYGYGFAGGADTYGVQIQVPSFLPRRFLLRRFRDVIFVGGLGRSHNQDGAAFGMRLGKGYGGNISLRRDGGQSPGEAAIIGKGQVGAALLGIPVVSTSDHAMDRVAEGDGGDSQGFIAVDDGGLDDRPCLARVGRTKYPRDLAPGSEPDVGLALGGNAGSAGGECAFSFDRRRKRVGRNRFPVLAAVIGCDQFKSKFAGMAGDGVAERDAVIRVPEGHAIEKSLGISVGKLQVPVLASVGGFVDARTVTRTGAQQIGEVGAKGFDIAKVQRFRARDLSGLPRDSGVHSSKISSVTAAGPPDQVGDHADTAKIGDGVGFLDGGILRDEGGGEETSDQKTQAHAIIVPEVMRLVE